MAEQQDIKEFPELSTKLAAPTKKSLFERQKAEAEAKRLREEAETAAVYEDFVKSFDDDDKAKTGGAEGHERERGSGRNESGFSGRPSAPSGRHFLPRDSQRKSGPGTLGPTSSGLGKKRPFESSRVGDRGRERGIFAFDESGPADAAAAFRASDDEDGTDADVKAAERAAPKPTLHLSSLPPGTSPAVIRSLIAPAVQVDGVQMLPPVAAAGSTGRRSTSAIVTLSKDTSASDIDAAVNAAQNRYLGFGFYLSISRHLSSAALASIMNAPNSMSSALSSLPFGAKMKQQGFGSSLNRAPPPGTHRGSFAPPASYTPLGPAGAVSSMQVNVIPPPDIKELKLIHKTLEMLLTHGPEFEALLMSRPEVQRSIKWAWLWDARSKGGVWYRWRLWEILTGSKKRDSTNGRTSGAIRDVFESGAHWAEPEEDLPFEFTLHFDDFISHPDYKSSDEEDSDEEGGPRKRRRQYQDERRPVDGPLSEGGDKPSYLNPLQRAKLTHLLARLPISIAKLRKGDVARVTAFAITHAGRGADEVVNMLVSNIYRPFSCSKMANPDLQNVESNHDQEKPKNGEQVLEISDKKELGRDDHSGSIQIALHLISDILSASSTSGVRHAWRYRSLVENAFSTRRVFSFLGRLEKQMGWGRLRAEKWKRSISGVLQLWEGWCVFPQPTHDRFVDEFEHPPLTEDEKIAELEKKALRTKDATKSKWRAVDADTEAVRTETIDDMDVDGEPLMEENVDGEEMDDLDGTPMEDVDGEPMAADDSKFDERQLSNPIEDGDMNTEGHQSPKITASATIMRVRRPGAEDMFADSDGE